MHSDYELIFYAMIVLFISYKMFKDIKETLDKNRRKEHVSPYGLDLIEKERTRQIEEEEWTLEHDQRHRGQQLAWAAVHYASPDQSSNEFFPKNWDPDHNLRNNMNRIQQLVAAGCFIISEIDRLKIIGEDIKDEN